MPRVRFPTAHLLRLVLAGTLAAAVPPALADGDHDGGHGGDAADIGHPGDAADVSRTVQVEMHDTRFERETITVGRGETVRFVVENEGELVHEFSIGTPAMHADHQEEMKRMMERGVLQVDRINRDRMGGSGGTQGEAMAHEHANSVLLEPGESAEVVWTFTTNAELEFACNVPGHYETGMHGDIRIGHDRAS